MKDFTIEPAACNGTTDGRTDLIPCVNVVAMVITPLGVFEDEASDCAAPDSGMLVEFVKTVLGDVGGSRSVP